MILRRVRQSVSLSGLWRQHPQLFAVPRWSTLVLASSSPVSRTCVWQSADLLTSLEGIHIRSNSICFTISKMSTDMLRIRHWVLLKRTKESNGWQNYRLCVLGTIRKKGSYWIAWNPIEQRGSRGKSYEEIQCWSEATPERVLVKVYCNTAGHNCKGR